MTTFAQALARIEELLHSLDNPRPIHSEEDEALWAHEAFEFRYLLAVHADSIVQLGKVAAEMRGSFTVRYDEGDESYVATKIDFLDLGEASNTYDKLMKGG